MWSQWPIRYLRSTIARSCKLDTAATTGPSVDQSLKNCVDDENRARQELVSQWSKFSVCSKAQCIPLEGIGGDPSYVSLLTLPANVFMGPMTAMFGRIMEQFEIAASASSGMRLPDTGWRGGTVEG